MSGFNINDDYIHIETRKKFEILKKGKEYYIKALEGSVDLNEVNIILVKHNIQVTNFINIRNAITTKLLEIVPFGTEKEKIVITVSNDGMKAYVTFYMTEAELLSKTKVLADLKAVIEQKGITFGVDLSKITKAEKLNSNTAIIIAEGLPRKKGENSVIKLNDVSDVLKPKQLEDGSVDHYDIGIVSQTQKGDLVGEYTKPTDGEPGMTVTGETVKAEKGKPAKISYDRRTIEEKDMGDRVCLYAKVNGALKRDIKGQIYIANHLVVDKVDFSTGNINFDGSVTVNNTVEDGFSIIATEDIEIRGAEGIGCVKEIISTNGNVLLSGGISGKGKSIIKGKNITSKYISNANIFVENTLTVKNFILNSCIDAKEVIMDKPSSQIAGGEIKNVCKLIVGSLGNESELRTSIDLGELNKEAIEQKIVEISNKIEENKIKIIKMDKLITDNMVTPDKFEAIVTLKSELHILNVGLEKEFNSIQKTLSMKGNAEIKVLKAVFPGVRINTEVETKFITEKMALVTILSKDGVIVVD